jgi:protein-disulfide isomerase
VRGFLIIVLTLAQAAIGKQPSPVNFTQGGSQASIEIHSYMDYLCPLCSQQNAVLHTLVNDYPEQVRWHFHLWPNDNNASQSLAKLAYCNGLINGNPAFWTLSDKLLSLPKATLRSAGLSQRLILSQRLAEPVKLQACVVDNNTKSHFIHSEEKARNIYHFIGTPGLVVIDTKNGDAIVLAKRQGLINSQELTLLLGLKKTAD